MFGIKLLSSAALLSALAVLVVVPATAKDKLPAKFKRSPYTLMSLTVGHPNHGWQVRPMTLKTSKYLRIKAGSKPNRFGHPALVKMLRRSARDIGRTVKGSIMLVGDLSAKKGGPLGGHRSHQTGRDADVAFYATDDKGKQITLDRFVAFRADGKATDGSPLRFDDHRNWLLVQSWIKDHRAGLSHIFVSTPLRKRLLRYARKHKRFAKHIPEALRLLKQPPRAGAHDDHFHVRISCPKKLREICHEHPR